MDSMQDVKMSEPVSPTTEQSQQDWTATDYEQALAHLERLQEQVRNLPTDSSAIV